MTISDAGVFEWPPIHEANKGGKIRIWTALSILRHLIVLIADTAILVIIFVYILSATVWATQHSKKL
jgi:hypothetical protein